MFVPSLRSRAGRLVLLAPSADGVAHAFRHVDVRPTHHERLLGSLQQLRGRVYLQDGAIEPRQLTADGRHVVEADAASWHLVSVQPDGRVTGCARYLPHHGHIRLEDLGVWNSALARHHYWQPWLRMAVESEIERASERGVAYVEVGGWAIAEDRRLTADAIELVLAAYALAKTVGGCLGITTATVRNCSSRILRKVGGRSLEIAGRLLPSYYDPQYRCEMEILRFDSHAPNPRYLAQIDGMAGRFAELPVLCAARAGASESRVRYLPTLAPTPVAVQAQACA
jgi:hypothetical protein